MSPQAPRGNQRLNKGETRVAPTDDAPPVEVKKVVVCERLGESRGRIDQSMLLSKYN